MRRRPSAKIRRRRETPVVYLVRWGDGVAKVGVTGGKRYEGFVANGATLLALIGTETGPEAYELEGKLGRLGHQTAFSTKAESAHYTGKLGGWRECFRCVCCEPDALTNLCVSNARAYADASGRAYAEVMPTAMQRRGEERRGLRGEGCLVSLNRSLSRHAGEEIDPEIACVCIDELESCPPNCLLRWF